MLNEAQIKERLIAAFPDAEVEVKDLTGGGDHWDVVVVSEAFAGQRRVRQHQMVYGVFDAELKSGVLHALALKTLTPEQRRQQQGG